MNNINSMNNVKIDIDEFDDKDSAVKGVNNAIEYFHESGYDLLDIESRVIGDREPTYVFIYKYKDAIKNDD